jgi:hypothetical protein
VPGRPGPDSASPTTLRPGLAANVSAAVAIGFAAVVAGVALVNWPSRA